MSDFIDALVDMLPEHNNLKKSNNELRRLLDISVGEWFDNRDITDFYSNLFLNSATGAYLDLFGKDYGVTRQVDESDDDYRERIVQEKNDRLTPKYLLELYGLRLYVYITGFNVVENTLTSDNPYIPSLKMSMASTELKNILNKKFIMDNSIVWYNGGELDYILNTSNVDITADYLEIYNSKSLHELFKNNTGIGKVKLTLPNATEAGGMFYGCTGLTELELDIPNSSEVIELLTGCTGLDKMTINMPTAFFNNNVLNYIFAGVNCSYVDLTVPSNVTSAIINLCKNMSNLTTLIVNGEEVDLS